MSLQIVIVLAAVLFAIFLVGIGLGMLYEGRRLRKLSATVSTSNQTRVGGKTVYSYRLLGYSAIPITDEEVPIAIYEFYTENGMGYLRVFRDGWYSEFSETPENVTWDQPKSFPKDPWTKPGLK